MLVLVLVLVLRFERVEVSGSVPAAKALEHVMICFLRDTPEHGTLGWMDKGDNIFAMSLIVMKD